ncbi:uncharacterized protein [Zea mays]|uniref:Uncharacterized protein n=1 Tax=Zea mays TaxID=4577 RepID=A0A1D6HWN9_MAIZE|nr:uncharacterized protein LOC103632167 isoform X2 [Zea mays]ONM52637.1 hypothetical protein ZEAMMB73_Zm00001d019293 [Zea mays]ONM52640.1 hypothetical protein ZEAMMB73_Zm00001d019293 [Zea mays]|eukprot:XP_020396829.1 uncharacterized protein LOC103632167 isoform X2 [Zea mays]
MTTVSGWDDESVLLNVMVIEATLVYESHRKRRASTCSNDDDTRSNTKYGDTVDRAPLFHAAKVYLAMVQIMPIHEILASTLIEKMTLQIFQTYHQGATFLQWCGAKTTTWSTQ